MFFSILTEKRTEEDTQGLSKCVEEFKFTIARYHKENHRKYSKCSALKIIYKIFSTIIRYYKEIIIKLIPYCSTLRITKDMYFTFLCTLEI